MPASSPSRVTGLTRGVGRSHRPLRIGPRPRVTSSAPGSAQLMVYGPPSQRPRDGAADDGGQVVRPAPAGGTAAPLPSGCGRSTAFAVRISPLGRPPLGDCAPLRLSGGTAPGLCPLRPQRSFGPVAFPCIPPWRSPAPRPHGRVHPGWFHALLTPLSRCFSQFPYGTCALSVFCLNI